VKDRLGYFEFRTASTTTCGRSTWMYWLLSATTMWRFADAEAHDGIVLGELLSVNNRLAKYVMKFEPQEADMIIKNIIRSRRIARKCIAESGAMLGKEGRRAESALSDPNCSC